MTSLGVLTRTVKSAVLRMQPRSRSNKDEGLDPSLDEEHDLL